MQSEAFEKHLKAAFPDHLPPVYLILAKEAYPRRHAIECLVALANKKAGEFDVATFDAERSEAVQVLQELKARTFFAKRRLIIVNQVELFNKDSLEKIEAYLAAPEPASCLAMTSSSLSRATNFYKKLEKIGVLLDIAEEKPWEKERNLVDWLMKAAHAIGKQLSHRAAEQLVKQLGTDQSLLDQELKKLACYVGTHSAIDEHAVQTISTSMPSDNGWQLGDAIFLRKASDALQKASELLASGPALIALLRQLRSQFQTKYQLASLVSQGASQETIAAEFPKLKGNFLRQQIQLAQSYGLMSLRDGLIAIDRAELQAKNSSLEPDFILEQLIIKLIRNYHDR